MKTAVKQKPETVLEDPIPGQSFLLKTFVRV